MKYIPIICLVLLLGSFALSLEELDFVNESERYNQCLEGLKGKVSTLEIEMKDYFGHENVTEEEIELYLDLKCPNSGGFEQ